MTNVQKCIEFVREVRVWEAAIEGEGSTPAREAKLKLARSNMKLTFAKLSAREAWVVRQQLGAQS
jgi:hypothetical protein